MCGIVGLFAKSPEIERDLGRHVAAMLGQMSDRGPDSAEVALDLRGLGEQSDDAAHGCSEGCSDAVATLADFEREEQNVPVGHISGIAAATLDPQLSRNRGDDA